MQEICSYGSVGVPAGNRRHYPEVCRQDAGYVFSAERRKL